MLPEDDPLHRIFIQEKPEADRALIADALEPFLRIYKNNGEYEVEFNAAWNDLPVRKKVLALLLARKAIRTAFPDSIEKEGMTPKEIEDKTEIVGGTLRPILVKLREAKLLQQDKTADASYYVPNRAVKSVAEQLKGKEE